MANIKLPNAPADYDRFQFQRIITDIETVLSNPTSGNDINAAGIPTSPVGLDVGQLYSDGGTLKVVV